MTPLGATPWPSGSPSGAARCRQRLSGSQDRVRYRPSRAVSICECTVRAGMRGTHRKSKAVLGQLTPRRGAAAVQETAGERHYGVDLTSAVGDYALIGFR